MKKTVVHLLMVSMYLFVSGGGGGCEKSVPTEEMTDAAEVAKADATGEEAEVVSSDVGARIDLRILYAGLPDTDRQKDFVKFLRTRKELTCAILASIGDGRVTLQPRKRYVPIIHKSAEDAFC